MFENIIISAGKANNSLDSISQFCNYVMHPTNILLTFWNWTVECSFYICLLVAMFSLICKVLRIKKLGKLTSFSIFIYILIQSIGKVGLK